ncbi:hypothetical protein BD413DRAFT_250713 [Trametes elegans]|nr:hypothetical protein BD413DRAFT_250713 [Trametes elegans]
MDPSAASDRIAANVTFGTVSLQNFSNTLHGLVDDTGAATLVTSRLYWGVLVPMIALTALFAAFTALAAQSVYFLIRTRGRQRSALVLSGAIAALYVSTCLYWASQLRALSGPLHTLVDELRGFGNAAYCLGEALATANATTDAGQVQVLCAGMLPDVARDNFHGGGSPLEECVPTASLTINILIGDAIVWWRALVLFERDRRLVLVSVALVAATAGLGIVDTVVSCEDIFIQGNKAQQGTIFFTNEFHAGELYGYNVYGAAAATLSLLTNVVATVLIACKAGHKRLIKDYLSCIPKRDQAIHVLVLLIESGAVYSILLTFAVAFGFATVPRGPRPISAQAEDAVLHFYLYLQSSLIPLIGMYPTAIILIVALKRSRCDAHFTHPGIPPSVPLAFAPSDTVSCRSTATTRTDGRELSMPSSQA